MKDDNQNPITPDLIKRLRDTASANISSKTSKDETQKEMSVFNGDPVVKKDVQSDLDQMKTAPRVTALTSNRRIELLNQLETLKEQGDQKDGLALYKEHLEMINPDFEDDDDYEEAHWVKTDYIENLYRQRKASTYWENI
jgi:hypothetical protein